MNHTPFAFIVAFQFRKIVDVSVETGMYNPFFWGCVVVGMIVHRMTIRFVYGTHGSPAGVRGNRMVFEGKVNQWLEDGIGFDVTRFICEKPVGGSMGVTQAYRIAMLKAAGRVETILTSNRCS